MNAFEAAEAAGREAELEAELDALFNSQDVGPGRDRTCALGVKSPAGKAAPRSHTPKRAATGSFRHCDELQRTAPDGDEPVLQSVLHFAAYEGNGSCTNRLAYKPHLRDLNKLALSYAGRVRGRWPSPVSCC